MRLAALLLAAPAVLQLVAADPRPTPASNTHQMRRVRNRWQFQRQDTPAVSPTPTPPDKSPTPTPAAPTPSTPAATPTSTPAATPPSSSPTPTPPTSTPTKTPDETETPNNSPVVTPTSTPNQSPTPTPTTPPAQSPTPSNNQGQAATPTPPPASSFITTSQVVTSTDKSGNVFTQVILVTATAPVSPSPSASDGSGESKPITRGTIIGLAVTGSIAGLIVILLIVWKLTNKRFSDLEDTGDDAIKWPELNKDSAAMTPIPARSTGRSGVDTGTVDNFDAQSSAANSTADLAGAHYQPYSDDPGYGARPAYYDPYGGVPGSARPYASPPGSHDGDHKNWGGPADNQYYDAPRVPSPGPNMAYGDALGRGTSPGPNMAYGDSLGRGASPGPNMAYANPTGRTISPAPGGYPTGYGAEQMGGDPYAGRRSPGPGLAYGGSQTDHGVDPYGRRSPGPGVAYGGGRAPSPGPNTAYDQGGYR